MNVQVKIGEQTYDVEIGDLSVRPVLARIGYETFEVWPEEEKIASPVAEANSVVQPSPAAQALVARPVSTSTPVAMPASGDKNLVVSAPIPGVITQIAVKPGDSVTQGQELCVLEAMKMKNAIRSPRGGVIAAVLVNVGDHVAKGHPLIQFVS